MNFKKEQNRHMEVHKSIQILLASYNLLLIIIKNSIKKISNIFTFLKYE